MWGTQNFQAGIPGGATSPPTSRPLPTLGARGCPERPPLPRPSTTCSPLLGPDAPPAKAGRMGPHGGRSQAAPGSSWSLLGGQRAASSPRDLPLSLPISITCRPQTPARGPARPEPHILSHLFRPNRPKVAPSGLSAGRGLGLCSEDGVTGCPAWGARVKLVKVQRPRCGRAGRHQPELPAHR